jgi:hypothetical protein
MPLIQHRFFRSFDRSAFAREKSLRRGPNDNFVKLTLLSIRFQAGILAATEFISARDNFL